MRKHHLQFRDTRCETFALEPGFDLVHASEMWSSEPVQSNCTINLEAPVIIRDGMPIFLMGYLTEGDTEKFQSLAYERMTSDAKDQKTAVEILAEGAYLWNEPNTNNSAEGSVDTELTYQSIVDEMKSVHLHPRTTLL